MDKAAIDAALDGRTPELLDRLGVTRDGRRWLCPFCQTQGRHRHGDLSCRGAAIKCFKCGFKGDLYQLVMEMKSLGFADALAMIAGLVGGQVGDGTSLNARPPRRKYERRYYATLEEAVQAVRGALGAGWECTRKDQYRWADTRLCAMITRWDNGQDKTYRPLSLDPRTNRWYRGKPDGGYPIYNLPMVAGSLERTVFVVEGEKVAEAGKEIGLLTTTTAHGAHGIKLTDMSPLRNRNVVLCPDNDEPGEQYMLSVAAHLERPTWLRLPVGEGEDLHDWLARFSGTDPVARLRAMWREQQRRGYS